MTESEWRKTTTSQAASSNQAKKASSSDTTAPVNSNTTVNPRERPKAHITYTNPIIPLVGAAPGGASLNPQQGGAPRLSGQNNTNKLSLSIKPLMSAPPSSTPSSSTTTQMTTPLTPTAAVNASNKQPQEQLFGFEDDFSSLNTITSSNQPSVVIRHPQQSANDSSNQFYQQNLLLPQPPAGMLSDKNRTHRRSASHTSSSSVPMFNNETTPTAFMSLDANQSSAAHAAPDLINMNTNMPSVASPAQQLQQQLLYQYQIQQQQQQQQQQQIQQYQIQQQFAHPANSLSVQTNNRLIAHSRSASASPK
jgi:hypothetical protein